VAVAEAEAVAEVSMKRRDRAEKEEAGRHRYKRQQEAGSERVRRYIRGEGGGRHGAVV